MTSAIISPSIKTTSTSQLVTVAAGCFWGVERVFKKHFGAKGLIDAKVGYANGIPLSGPVTYEKVCTGSTKYAEAVQISYEPAQLSLKDLLEIFFRIHDPTTVNAQGPDQGTQYRSAIYTHTENDFKIAQEVKSLMQQDWYPGHHIVTQIEPLESWFDGEEYHQAYLDKNPGGYECPTHFLRTSPKI